MTKDEDFKLLKIRTCVLKVNIHCDGCKQKVKKLLLRIEGVYTVNIDAEQQKVTVSGSVDSETLIRKLVRAGKHTELWSQKSNQNPKQKVNCVKNDKNNKGQHQSLIKGLEAFKAQQKFSVINSEEDEDEFDEDEEDEEDDEEEELRFLREKANQLSLLRQQALDASNAKKGFGAIAASNNGKINNNVGNGNAQKKPNPNQNMGMKVNPGGIDQKSMAALKMSNPHLVGGGGNINPAEGKRGNDINSMMGLGGFLGNGGGNIAPTATSAFGGNSNGLGGFQIQSNGFQGSDSTGLFPNGGMATGHHHPSSMMMNLNGGNQHNYPSQMMMNVQQNRHAIQQPQMMYYRSPLIPPSTGYYFNYSPAPSPSPYASCDTNYSSDNSANHMFTDENTSSCSIM